jgi:hypothetical protein
MGLPNADYFGNHQLGWINFREELFRAYNKPDKITYSMIPEPCIMDGLRLEHMF